MTVLKDYNWGRFDRYIDIGGAYGSFLASLLSRHPAAQGVLFDQSQVSTMVQTQSGIWTMWIFEFSLRLILCCIPRQVHRQVTRVRGNELLAGQKLLVYDGCLSYSCPHTPIIRVGLQCAASKIRLKCMLQVVERAESSWMTHPARKLLTGRTAFTSGDFFKPGLQLPTTNPCMH